MKDFCKHGHDTRIVGRITSGGCRACHKLTKAKYKPGYRASLRQLVNTLKAGGCSQCGERDLRCLDFHHIDPTTKRAAVAALCANYGKKAILEEVAKCIVLCSNCHRKLGK